MSKHSIAHFIAFSKFFNYYFFSVLFAFDVHYRIMNFRIKFFVHSFNRFNAKRSHNF